MLCFTLIIILKRTSRKSKSAKRKSLLQNKCNENQICDEIFQGHSNGHSKNYLNETSSKQSNHVYQHMVPLYHEIDDLVELLPISTSTEFGDHNISKWINNPNNITTTMT